MYIPKYDDDFKKVLFLNCHIYASIQQRLNAVNILPFQHPIKTLCWVLKVKRSTYYKYFSASPVPRVIENKEIGSKMSTVKPAFKTLKLDKPT